MPRPMPELLKRAEIVPVAPAQEPEEQESLLGKVRRYGQNVAGGFAASTGAGMGAGLLARGYVGLHGGRDKWVAGDTGRPEIDAIARHVGLDPKNIEVTDNHMGELASSTPAHTPGEHVESGQPGHIILAQKSKDGRGAAVQPAIVGHELGHGVVSDFLHRRLGKHAPLANVVGSNIGAHFINPLAAVGAGMGSRNSAIVGTAATMPLLANELLASHFGGRAMLKHQNPTTFGGKAKAYLSAYKGVPTYMLQAAVPLAAYGANRLYHKALEIADRDKKEKDKPALLAKAGCVAVRKRGRA